MDTAQPPVTEPRVVVDFTLTEDEVVRCLRSKLRERPVVVILPATGVICLVFAALSVAAGHGRGWGVYLLFMGLYEFWVTSRIFSSPHRVWRKSISLRSKQRIVFAEHGVETETALGDSRLRWQYFRATHEREGCYLLEAAGRRAYHIIPRRAFASLDDEMTARALFSRHTQAHFYGAS